MPRRRIDYDSLEMEREFEEKVELKRKHVTNNNRLDPRGQKRKPPILLRLLTWCGVILLCFVAGYHGTSYMLDQQWFIKEKLPVMDDGGGVETAIENRLDMQKMALSIFYPKNGALVEGKIDVIVNTREDNIQDAVLKLLEFSGLSDGKVQVHHVFRNADTVYLNFSGNFVDALKKAGARPSTLLITGIVRTMRDNFSPITKVRFLVDSKAESTGAPVDLTATWQLPR